MNISDHYSVDKSGGVEMPEIFAGKYMIMMFGRMGSGKTYIAEKLKQLFHQYGSVEADIMSSSKYLKAEFDRLCDLMLEPSCSKWKTNTRLSFDEDFVKSVPVFRSLFDQITYFDQMLHDNMTSAETKIRAGQLLNLTKRQILQIYGTEIPILFDQPKIWINKLLDEINEAKRQLVINDGCRFAFEINSVRHAKLIPITVLIGCSDELAINTFIERYGSYTDFVDGKTLNHFSDVSIFGKVPSQQFDVIIPERPDSDGIFKAFGKIVNHINLAEAIIGELDDLNRPMGEDHG